jgi:hypothetical protein
VWVTLDSELPLLPGIYEFEESKTPSLLDWGWDLDCGRDNKVDNEDVAAESLVY